MTSPDSDPTSSAATSLDSRIFDMVSSTASIVDQNAPTRFHYSERDGVIWGGYDGDSVLTGRFCGNRTGDRLNISFVHHDVNRSTTSGQATAVITQDTDGALVLTESFTGPDGSHQTSVCREVIH